jgi:hypothetical protein
LEEEAQAAQQVNKTAFKEATVLSPAQQQQSAVVLAMVMLLLTLAVPAALVAGARNLVMLVVLEQRGKEILEAKAVHPTLVAVVVVLEVWAASVLEIMAEMAALLRHTAGQHILEAAVLADILAALMD